MAGAFSTGSVEMTTAVTKMDEAHAQLQQSVTTLMNEVQELTGSWAGTAASAFTSLMGRFQTDMNSLNSDLQNISDQVGANNKTYQAREEDNSSSLSNIAGRLGG